MTLTLVTNLDAACWAACPFIRGWVDWALKGEAQEKRECKKCPQWETIDGEKSQRACRAIVEEALKPALQAYQANKEKK